MSFFLFRHPIVFGDENPEKQKHALSWRNARNEKLEPPSFDKDSEKHLELEREQR
jgi:hypothetical protein